MSTSMIAVRNMDGEFKKMMNLKKICDENEVSYPEEVQDYFGDCASWDEKSIEKEMLELELIEGVEFNFLKEDMVEGFTVNVEKLRPEVKHIKFKNSW